MIDKKITTSQELENKIEKLLNEIIIANKELVFQNEEKQKRADELIIANKELAFQNKEKQKRADELIIANKELVFQNEEKQKRADELIIANKELAFQNEEKAKRADELAIANKELIFQHEEKIKRAEELGIIKGRTEEDETLIEELTQTNEELIKAKEKAQESERLKSAFLSNMSHEIRTPLNIITGYSEFLAEINLSKEERTEYISLINSNSIRLLNLIDNILDLSKIEAGQKIVKLKIFNINKLMDELFDQNKKAIAEKQLEFCVHKALKNEQALINSSEQFIYQIFTNLLNNAIKYSLSGKIDYGYNIVNDKEIELFVSDTGIGISKEYVSNIFNRFSQENSALSRTYEGAGLGLSIVKGIVELLHGTIKVNSEKGNGTTFKITLPLNNNHSINIENQKQNNVEIIKEKQNTNKITLLIVEDDLTSFHLLNKQILREFACDIIHAMNGHEAIEKVNAHPEITHILMDLHLPGIDGCETTERIKEINKNLPVFAVTAAVMDIDKEKAMNAGCDEFLSKPVDREKLFDLILKYEKINNTIKKINDKQITLLIVEDDEASFYLLNLQISEEINCKIIHAINGLSAIEKVKEHPEITCVLMDLHMPGIDGCETTERIKKINEDLPVFAVTAATVESAKAKAMNAGCNEFFSKPVDRELLYNLILKYEDDK